MRATRLIASLLAVLAAPAALAAQARRFTLEDLGSLVSVSDPQFSPDGRSLVALVSRPDYEHNRRETRLVLIDIPTGRRRTLVHGPQGLSHPRWGPRGDRIAYLGPGVPRGWQVFVLSVAEPDARQLTHAPRGVRRFAWRPDGREIAFATPELPRARTGVERHNDSFEVGNDDYLTTEAPTAAHLWLVPIERGVARRLTTGPWSLATGLVPPAFSWAPDGRAIAFARIATPHSGDSDQSTIALVEVATGAIRQLTGRSAREGSPAFSPDGGRVAYSHPRDGDPVNVEEIFVSPVAGGEGASVTRALDRNVLEAAWMPGGRTLLVAANDGTRVSLWLQPLAGPARRLELGDVTAVSDVRVSAAGAVAFVGSEPRRPEELYVLGSTAHRPRRLTDFNAPIAELALARAEPIEWEGPDGFRGDGVLTLPPNLDSAARYPLVLYIHGGPTAASTREFSPLAQLMAARGWVVFQPNYRGSDNRGNAYQRAIANDAGEGPGRDVMAGIAAVEARGLVDPARVAVSGWSYGGYMTAWLIGRYPDRWSAAVAGAAPTDLVDMYALSDLNVMRRHALTESPWRGERLRALAEQSPITHAGRIRTPTLILSNTGDQRVAVTGSYKLYRALRDNGVPVQFVAYPASGHFPGDPVRARDVYRRWLAWIDEHFSRQEAKTLRR